MMVPPELAAGIRMFSVWVIPLVLAITLHEAAHGIVAWRMGDDTAYRMGRVSANPAVHIDPFGTIILPGMLLLMGGQMMFGWAKPVPVNFGRLRPLRLGMILVAMAGPFVNIVLAVISALLLYLVHFLPESGQVFASSNLQNSVQLNLVLAVFNMLPLPPLDGGRVLVGVLPRPWGYKLSQVERYSFVILLVGLFVLPMLGFRPFTWLVGLPASLLEGLIYHSVGL
jgi:Zn-dependent protease